MQRVLLECALVELSQDFVRRHRLLQMHDYFHQAVKVKTPSGSKRLNPVNPAQQQFLPDQTPYIWTYEISSWMNTVLGMSPADGSLEERQTVRVLSQQTSCKYRQGMKTAPVRKRAIVMAVLQQARE